VMARATPAGSGWALPDDLVDLGVRGIAESSLRAEVAAAEAPSRSVSRTAAPDKDSDGALVFPDGAT
jgi:hypothetical protein